MTANNNELGNGELDKSIKWVDVGQDDSSPDVCHWYHIEYYIDPETLAVRRVESGGYERRNPYESHLDSTYGPYTHYNVDPQTLKGNARELYEVLKKEKGANPEGDTPTN